MPSGALRASEARVGVTLASAWEKVFNVACFVPLALGANLLGALTEHRVAVVVLIVVASRVPYLRCFSWTAVLAVWAGFMPRMNAAGGLAKPNPDTEQLFLGCSLLFAGLCLAKLLLLSRADLRRSVNRPIG